MSRKIRKAPHSASEQIYPTIETNSSKATNKQSMQGLTTRTNQNKLIIHRLQTQPIRGQAVVPFQDQWEQMFNRRESHLNSMFNRRKSALQSISKRNRDIYLRITTQQSHYPISKILKEQHNESKSKNSLQNLTANSRIMLTLSKYALKNQENRLSSIADKENMTRINEIKDNCKKVASRHLAPILQNAQNSVLSPKTNNFQQKDECVLNSKVKLNTKARHKSVGRARMADIYTNF